VVNGTCEEDWAAVAELAGRFPWVIPSFGVHPWKVAGLSAEWRARLLARVEECGGRCGIGEIGLDRWMKQPDAAQREVFLWQLRLAAERNLPVSIHCLKAWGALWEILREEPLPERGFLLHAYGGPVEMLEGFVKRGAYFSFSGYFLRPGKRARLEAFRRIPADRLLVETDAPSMPLPPERVRHPLPPGPDGMPVSHPADLAVAYEGLAETRGEKPERLAAKVAENFARLFGVL